MEHQCFNMLVREWDTWRCPRKAVVERKGKWYCKQHDPGPDKGEIWYQIYAYNVRIDPVEVVAHTEKTVTQKGGRKSRRDEIFPTWQEAHAALLRRVRQNVETEKSHLAYAQDALKKVEAMQPPGGEE